MTIIYTIIPFLISLFISFLIGKLWVKETKTKNITLNAEALRNPINTGITVSGFLLPIIVGIMTFSFISNKNIVNNNYYIFSSIILIISSIFFGLWNNYSLATLTNEEGQFQITKDNNTFFPAFFVFQLSLLFFGIILFGMFGYNNMNKDNIAEKEYIKYESISNVFVQKEYISINAPRDLLLELWGKPSEIIDSDSVEEFIYKANKSSFIYTIINDTVININQKIEK